MRGQQRGAAGMRMRTKLPLALFVSAKGIHDKRKHVSRRSNVAECDSVQLGQKAGDVASCFQLPVQCEWTTVTKRPPNLTQNAAD
jgi:hypothetical protein